MTATIEELVRSVEELRDHAAEIVGEIAENKQPLVISIDGQAKAVLVDLEAYRDYKEIKRGIALLKILDKRSEQIERGETYPVEDVFKRIEEKLLARKS